MTHTSGGSSQPSSPISDQPDRLSVNPEALFVYGSLQFPDVLLALIGRVPDHEPAAVEGWRVATLPGRVYPVLIPGAATAAGYLLTGLTPAEWRLLDTFEDPVYELKRLDLVDGRHGWTYACNQDIEVGQDTWSPEDFQSKHLPDYLERCATWRQRHEAKQANQQASDQHKHR